MAALAVGVAVGILTINAPVFQGPLSKALFDGNLAWIAAPLAGALTYWLLARRALAQGREPG